MNSPMPKVFPGLCYLLGHLFSGAVCTLSMAVIPMVILLVLAIVYHDPGGPLWPVLFLVLLLFGFIVSLLLSLIVLVIDLVRLRLPSPVWWPPLLVFAGFAAAFFFSARHFIPPSGLPLSVILCLAFISGLAFSLYWLVVSLFRRAPHIIWEQAHRLSGVLGKYL